MQKAYGFTEISKKNHFSPEEIIIAAAVVGLGDHCLEQEKGACNLNPP